MLLAAFYLIAVTAIVLHYTGHLKRWNCEWVLFILAIAVFPAVLML
jgi:low affinity Fe/Cu permease